MASAFALAIFSGGIIFICEWKMTAVIFHSPFHAWGCAGKLQLPIERLTAFSSDTNRAIPSPALLPCGQQGPTPADGPQRNCQPLCGFSFYFLIFCKCFMPSSKRLRKASTSSGVLSAQKDTRMAVSMASGSRPMAASVWLG